uniref:THAP-type domain-containing protein n=1 Tax=Mola mola TaxID=94237 RepID=A0A3Q3XHH6_MOLML
MGRYTCAYDCEHSGDSDVKFPLYNPRKLKKWLVNMRWKDWTPSRFSVLCINHFEEQYIDRTGKSVTLREDAVPTIFSAPDDAQKRKKKVCMLLNTTRINSFPHFFHGDYCVPQVSGILKVCYVTEPWQWLGLDVRGPLPQTLNGHKYVLTVTDYFSKWVEAVPMESCLPSSVVKHIVDIIAHFGYPLRILSRLPHDIVHKVSVLQPHMLLLFSTSQYTYCIQMVNDLIEEHSADWDVYLPAKIFSLCFKERSETKERPFSVLCCRGPEPVHCPRGLDVSVSLLTTKPTNFVLIKRPVSHQEANWLKLLLRLG